MVSITEQVKKTILDALPDAEVMVVDPLDDGQHFEAVVISAQFEGVSLVKQHQMVMRPLTAAFATNLHALSLKTFTPSQWENQ